MLPVARVQPGADDPAKVYVSDAMAGPTLPVSEVAAELHMVAGNPVSALLQSRNAGAGRQFTAFVRSPDGQSKPKKSGFDPAQ